MQCGSWRHFLIFFVGLLMTWNDLIYEKHNIISVVICEYTVSKHFYGVSR